MGVHFVVRSRGGEKVSGEPEFPFEQSRIVIGRGSAADVRIPDRTVSEHHATVHARDDHFVIVDMASTNGTRIEGQRLSPQAPKRLRDGDRIDVGSYQLSFHTGVLVRQSVSAERTAELARRLLRDAVGATSKPVPSPRLCVLSGPATGTTRELLPSPSRLLVGSAVSCGLVLPDPAVAGEHLEIVCDAEGVLCRTLGSAPGFSVGASTLSSRRLRDGDELTVGTTRVLFEEPAQALLDALKAEPDLPAPAPAFERTEAVAPAGSLTPSAAALAPRAAPAKPERRDTDVLIYVLAVVVLVASAIGLVVLLRAS